MNGDITQMHPQHLRHAPRDHFVVVYLHESCEEDDIPWHASVAIPSGAEADRRAGNLRMTGHKALVKRVGEVMDHGVPMGTRLTLAGGTGEVMEWKFIENPPDQSSSDDDWYALEHGGYIKPEDVLADPNQVRRVREAQAVLSSFFQALRDANIRTEM